MSEMSMQNMCMLIYVSIRVLCQYTCHYFMFFGATVLRKVLHICPYSTLEVDIEWLW